MDYHSNQMQHLIFLLHVAIRPLFPERYTLSASICVEPANCSFPLFPPRPTAIENDHGGVPTNQIQPFISLLHIAIRALFPESYTLSASVRVESETCLFPPSTPRRTAIHIHEGGPHTNQIQPLLCVCCMSLSGNKIRTAAFPQLRFSKSVKAADAPNPPGGWQPTWASKEGPHGLPH